MTQLFARSFRWEKRGLIIAPRPELWWMRTHAMVPTVEALGGSLFKVYFSGRDDRNRSQIGWAVLDVSGVPRIVDFAAEPVLSIGDLGAFDDNGVTPSCVIRDGDKTLLYYIGWNQGATVRMLLFGGLAISEDGGKSFRRYSRAPILERTHLDPFMNTGPWVIRQGALWRIYYVCGVEWVHKDLPRYHIRTATSSDGLTWDRRGQVAIDFASPDECALARPMVLKDGDIYRMWFGHKSSLSEAVDYRLGYAESHDGLNWQRRDQLAGLSVSAEGWDSQMVEYACVFEHEHRKYMLYNGNNYGRSGIGLAIER